MPVTSLMKAIGMNNQEILAAFHDTDSFQLGAEDIQFSVVPERLRGEVAKFDIVAPMAG